MSDPNPFSYASTAQSVHQTLDEAMKAVPAGHTGAALMKITATPAGGEHAELAVVSKLGDNWTFAVGGDASWKAAHITDYGVQFGLMGSWGGTP